MRANPRDLEYELNRLAATLVSGRPSVSAQRAANIWLGGGQTYDLLGALNRKAGITNPKNFLGMNAVCNLLAGTTNQDPAHALSTIP